MSEVQSEYDPPNIEKDANSLASHPIGNLSVSTDRLPQNSNRMQAIFLKRRAYKLEEIENV